MLARTTSAAREVIALMRKLIPADRHAAVAVAVVIRAQLNAPETTAT